MRQLRPVEMHWDLRGFRGPRGPVFGVIHACLVSLFLVLVAQALTEEEPLILTFAHTGPNSPFSSGLLMHLLFRPKPIRTISGGVGIYLQIRIRFSSSRNFFSNDSNFWCVQSSITHTLWPYMCMCCGLFAPTQFHFECCGVRDDS